MPRPISDTLATPHRSYPGDERHGTVGRHISGKG
jgi:hypothetical protein